MTTPPGADAAPRDGEANPNASHAALQAQILPCPCCGGVLPLFRHYNTMCPEPEAWGGYYVECAVCDLTIDPDCDAAEAIAKINRRAADPVIHVTGSPDMSDETRDAIGAMAGHVLRHGIDGRAPDPRPAPDAEREAAVQLMREALESAYAHTFNAHCSGDKEQEHEQVHEEILEACSAADRVGIKCGDRKPFDDARLSRVAGIIQDGLNHEMGAVMIARSIVAALEKP